MSAEQSNVGVQIIVFDFITRVVIFYLSVASHFFLYIASKHDLADGSPELF